MLRANLGSLHGILSNLLGRRIKLVTFLVWNAAAANNLFNDRHHVIVKFEPGRPVLCKFDPAKQIYNFLYLRDNALVSIREVKSQRVRVRSFRRYFLAVVRAVFLVAFWLHPVHNFQHGKR